MSDKQPPWVEFSYVWSTKAKFMSWLRGGIRGAIWNTSPIKLEFLKKNRKKINNPNPKGKVPTVWGATCELCNEDYVTKNIQVDHKKGNHSLRSVEDVQSFVEAIIMISHDDLQLVCKQCHECKSYGEKNGMTFEEAKVEKQVIKYCALPAEQQKEILESYNLPCNNGPSRRESFRQLLKEGKL